MSLRSSQSKNLGKLLHLYNSSSLGSSIAGPISATGGDIVRIDDGFQYHTFTSPGDFNVFTTGENRSFNCRWRWRWCFLFWYW